MENNKISQLDELVTPLSKSIEPLTKLENPSFRDTYDYKTDSSLHNTTIKVLDNLYTAYPKNSKEKHINSIFDDPNKFNFIGNNSRASLVGEVSFASIKDSAYAKIDDTTYKPKYGGTFYRDLDNEDMAAQRQSGWEQWGNGIAKNTGKFLSYVADATIGNVYGTLKMIEEGSLSAFTNNDFSKWIDKLGRELDYELPNYISEEEKNMSFLRKMGTANFWGDTILHGMAFMGGAIGGELLWAVVTGGSSLALTWAKLGAKFGGKAFIKAGVATEKAAAKAELKGLFGAYQRSIAKSEATAAKALAWTGKGAEIGRAANNARFIWTSAGFESSIESRSAFDEAKNNFRSAINSAYGREPTVEEYKEFLPKAQELANKVFAANLFTVGASNILQFGSMLKIGGGISKAFSGTTKLVNRKLLGQGINKVTGTAIKGNVAQRAFGKTFMFLKNPLVEGNEEAMQGVYSRAMQNVLGAKYDPSALNEHYTGAQALYDGIKDSYGTKEGQEEFFVGAIIGKLGGVAGGAKSFMSSLPSGYNAMYRNNERLATAMEGANTNMETVTNSQIERSLSAIQQKAHMNKSTEAEEKGDNVTASVEFYAAQRAKMEADYNAGMLDESLENFKTVIEKSNDEELAKSYGVDVSEVKGLKDGLINEYASLTKSFKNAKKVADAFSDPIESKNLKAKHYNEEITHNLFMGVVAARNFDNNAITIQEMTGKGGIADVLTFYTQLSKDNKNKVASLNLTKKNILKLQDEYVALQQEYSILQESKPRIEENKGHVAKVAANRAKAAKVLEKQQALQKESEEIKAQINKAPKNKTFTDIAGLTGKNEVSGFELENVLDHLDELDGFIESLEQTDPHAAETLKQQLSDFKRTSEHLNNFQKIFTDLTSDKFSYNRYKGIMGLFKNPAVFEAPKDKTKLNEVDRAIEDEIEAEGLDEYSAFQYRLLRKMEIQMDKDSDFTDFEEKLSETVSDDDWKEYTENRNVTDAVTKSITTKIINNEPLSLREKQIYSKNEEFIKSEVVKEKKAIGDSIKSLRRQRLKVSKDDSLPTTLDVIKDLIDKIFKSKEYLEGLGISDFSETDVPTEKDYRDVNRWEQNKGNLSPRLQAKYEEVKDKINKWGQIEGTFAGKYSLGGLYNQMFALEELEKTAKDGKDVTDGIEISEVVNSDDIEMVANKRHYNILQSYDKVFFSRSTKGIHIHNINLKGFFDEIVGKIGLDRINFITVNKKTMSTTAEIESAIKDGVDFREVKISYQSENGTEKIITITRGDNNELILPQQSINNVNNDTDLKVVVTLGKSKLMTNYFAVLKLINGKLIALSSNFIDKSAASQDPSETQKLKKGDILIAEVDLQDEWNKELLAKYNKGKITIDELRKQIKIRLIDGSWNLAGVIKAETNNAGVDFDSLHFEAIVKIREQAVNKILTNLLDSKEVAVTTVKVEDVYLGHPILNINEDFSVEQEEFTVDNVDSVVDVGYIENGQVKTRSGDRNIIYSYVNSVIKDKTGKYKDKRVPFVVLEVAGKRVAYPVSLKTEIVNLTGQVDAIINEVETSDVDKAIKLNTLLSENGFDVTKLKILDSNFRGKMKEMAGMLSSVDKYMDISLLLDKDSDLNSLLINNVLIDIDPMGDKFHSPKVKIDLGESVPKNNNKPSDTTEESDIDGESNLFTTNTTENDSNKQEPISTKQQPSQGSNSGKAKNSTKNTTKKVPKTSLGNVYKRALDVLDQLRGGSSDVLVLEYFIGGGKISKSALESFFGVGNSEIALRKTFIGNITVSGKEVTTMDGMADYISSLQEGEDRVSNEAIRNSLENYMSNFQNKTEMAKNVLSTFSNLESSTEEIMNEQEEVFGEDETYAGEATKTLEDLSDEQIVAITEEETYEDLISKAKASGTDKVFSDEDISNMTDEQLVIVADIIDFPTKIYEEQERRKNIQEENDASQQDNQVETDTVDINDKEGSGGVEDNKKQKQLEDNIEAKKAEIERRRPTSYIKDSKDKKSSLETFRNGAKREWDGVSVITGDRMKNLYVGIQLFVEAYQEHKELLDKFIKKENGTIGITNNNLSFILNALKKQGITTESELGGKINAKYDEELKALGQQSTSNVGVKEGSVGVVGDAEYNDFIDKGKVSNERLNDIANKVKNREPLSDREKAIFSDKTGEINKIIAKEEVVPTKESNVVETSNVGGDEEAKKVDIERRRQEELKQPIKDKLQEIEKAVKTLNITTDKDGKLEQTSDEIITNIKSELDKIGLPYKGVASNENGSSYKVITNDGTEIEVVKLLKSGGALIKPTLSTAKFINHLIKTEPQTLRDLISNQINAKYDAKYVDAVKKGEMTKEQAMQALEEAGRKDSSAYAELEALENTNPVSDKKADTERRKQEESLDKSLASKPAKYNNDTIDIDFGQSWNTGKYNLSDILFLSNKKEFFNKETVELYNYLISLNPTLKNIKVENNNRLVDIVRGLASGLHFNDIKYFVEDLKGDARNQLKDDDLLQEKAYKAYEERFGEENDYKIGFALSPETANRVINNAKYDVELKASEQPTTSNVGVAEGSGGVGGDMKRKPILFEDKNGNKIVFEKGDYRISVDDENYARNIVLWHREKVNGKEYWAKRGVLNANIKESRYSEEGDKDFAKYLSISEVEIEKDHRGQGLSTQLYKALINYSGDDIKAILSYTPSRVNKTQVPKIWKRLGGRTSKFSEDYQIIDINRTKKAVEQSLKETTKEETPTQEVKTESVIEQDEIIDGLIEDNTTNEEIAEIAEEENKTVEEVKQEITSSVHDTVAGRPISVSARIKNIVDKVLKSFLTIGLIINTFMFTSSFSNYNAPISTLNIESTIKIDKSYNDLTSDGKKVYLLEIKNNKSFVLIDKPTATGYIYDSTGRLINNFPVLLGRDKGDGVNVVDGSKDKLSSSDRAITSSGKFKLTKEGIQKADIVEYKDKIFLLKDGNGVAIHITYQGELEKRTKALNTKTISDNRQSWGCVNISESNFDKYVTPYIKEGSSIIITRDFQPKESISKSTQKVNIPTDVLNKSKTEQNKKCK